MKQRLIHLPLLAAVVLFGAQPTGPKTFASPADARDALIQAAGKSMDAVRDIMGTSSTEFLLTGDAVQDNTLLKQFNQRVAQKTKLEADEMNPNRVTLFIGDEEWPFAVPLVRKNGSWFFDGQEGKAEIRRRIIGANELDAMEVCHGYVESQKMYATNDWDGNGKLEYASKIASTPGKKDGLYWPGEDSPISEAVATAMAEGYSAPNSAAKGYHGYHYKILLAQGSGALDGEQDYVVHGLMIGGFALVAWPAEYGVSGIMTFIVNQDGVVYQKDLGKQTGTVARAMSKFNPDKSWSIPEE